METRTHPICVDARGFSICFKHAVKRAQRGEEVGLTMKDPTAEWCGCEDCVTEAKRKQKDARHEINVAWLEVFLRKAIIDEQAAAYCKGHDAEDLTTEAWMRISGQLLKVFKDKGLLAEGIEVR